MLQQTVSIFGHFEEIAFLFYQFHFPSAIRTFAVHQLPSGKEGLTRGTVPAFIIGDKDVSLIINLLKYLLYHGFMAFLGGTDKIIVADQKGIPQTTDIVDYVIHILQWFLPLLPRHLFYLLTMFIGTGQIKYIIPLHSFKTGHAISRHGSIGMAYM